MPPSHDRGERSIATTWSADFFLRLPVVSAKFPWFKSSRSRANRRGRKSVFFSFQATLSADSTAEIVIRRLSRNANHVISPTCLGLCYAAEWMRGRLWLRIRTADAEAEKYRFDNPSAFIGVAPGTCTVEWCGDDRPFAERV